MGSTTTHGKWAGAGEGWGVPRSWGQDRAGGPEVPVPRSAGLSGTQDSQICGHSPREARPEAEAWVPHPASPRLALGPLTPARTPSSPAPQLQKGDNFISLERPWEVKTV